MLLIKQNLVMIIWNNVKIFKKRYNESEYTEILALNNKRKGKFDIILQNII